MEGERIVVACLACGLPRETRRTYNGLDADECPWCGYLGWIPQEASPAAGCAGSADVTPSGTPYSNAAGPATTISASGR